MSNSDITLICGDCIEELPKLSAASVDMIFCDLPYGITSCKWDKKIDLEKLWNEYMRIIKKNSAIVLTASQPFTSQLVMSNLKNFRCEWIYTKTCASNFAQARYAPMKEHESVLVFANGCPIYHPIKEPRNGGGVQRAKYAYSERSRHRSGEFICKLDKRNGLDNDAGNDELRYPSSVRKFNNRAKGDRGLHPTQKPQALCEYFIRTYTEPGGVVLDNCMGSGTVGAAAANLGRKFIGIEKDPGYFDIAKKRIEGVCKL